jgi:hypothetical protein
MQRRRGSLHDLLCDHHFLDAFEARQDCVVGLVGLELTTKRLWTQQWGARGDIRSGSDADRTMIRSARNQQQDDPESTGIPARTERYCHRSGRE